MAEKLVGLLAVQVVSVESGGVEVSVIMYPATPTLLLTVKVEAGMLSEFIIAGTLNAVIVRATGISVTVPETVKSNGF